MEATWIGIAFVAGLALRQFGLPPLVGYLAAGFALNAAGLHGGPTLEHLAHLGVLLLLFGVGLKLRLRSLLRPEVWGGGSVHLALSALLFVPALHFLAGLGWVAAGLLGTTLGFSSTVVAAKVLEQKRELRAFHGRVAIGILIIQDLVAVALLSLTGGGTPSPWALVLLGLPLLRPVLAKVLELTGHGELLVLYGMLLGLVVGGAGFQAVGLSGELGALLVGALLADHPRAVELANAIWSLKEVFLVGFFLHIGMAALPDAQSVAAAALLVLALPLKAALFQGVLVAFRLRARSAFLTALSLASYSEFALIVASLAVRNGLLGEHWLATLGLAAAFSFALAAPLNRLSHDLYGRFETQLRRFELERRHPDEQPISLGTAHVVIVGMGRVGTGAYDFQRSRQEHVVGLDSDPGKVERHRAEGRRVVYADAEDPGFWHQLNLDGVHAVLLAMPETEAKRIAATQLRARGYPGLISATTVYPEQAELIRAAGADLTFNFYDEAGVGFAEHTWEVLHPDWVVVPGPGGG